MQWLPVRRSTLAIAIALAGAGALILLVVGYWQGAQFRPTATDAPPAASSAPAATALDLSIFDPPRDLPEIRFVDAAERGLTLADFRGKIVLLNLWATWCAPCRHEMPSLDRLQAQLGGDDFIVLALSIDRAGLPAVRRFYEELGLQHLGIYVDAGGAGLRTLGVPGLPMTLLIDRAGREVARKMGAAEWDDPETVALIRQQIEAPAPDRRARSSGLNDAALGNQARAGG
jgi:thiol-disulfide isomerase/thioredoxin